MLIVISPAKTLDYSVPTYSAHSLPDFTSDVKALVGVMKKKSAADISQLMHISANLAALNEERYKTFQSKFTPENSKQALLAFKGDVYTKIEVDSYTEKDFEFAQNHLRILSGLYGLLRPLDLIQPYRLEMGTRLETSKGNNLYEYWGNRIAKHLNKEADGKPIVNLASQEYFKAVDLKTLKTEVKTIHFKEFKNGSYQVIGLFAKQARGMMTNYAIKNRITAPEQVKLFNLAGYEFADSQSTSEDWVFVR